MLSPEQAKSGQPFQGIAEITNDQDKKLLQSVASDEIAHLTEVIMDVPSANGGGEARILNGSGDSTGVHQVKTDVAEFKPSKPDGAIQIDNGDVVLQLTGSSGDVLCTVRGYIQQDMPKSRVK